MKGNKSRKKINNYVIHFDQPLGAGASGKVFLCIDQDTQVWRAVKIIQKSQFDENPYMAEAVKQELQIHRSLQHENIVSVFDVVQTANNYYILMELCPNGSLRNLIVTHTILSEHDAIHCLRNICRAFQPMFEKGIMHRDLKPENVVIHGDKLKVTDFGFAKALSSSRELTRTVIGTPLYMSPQILSKQPYSSKCDIWSIGVIFYELMIGRHPWSARSMPQLFRVISRSSQVEIPPEANVSKQSRLFLKKCLQIQECNRLSWLQLYESDIMGPDFEAIAQEWRKAYETAAFKLGQLRENIQPEKLVGVFLRINVSALNFQQFTAIIRSLLPSVEEKQLGPMYELFDKDSNGVIDLQQFVGALSDCPKTVLQLLNRLLMNGHSYAELSDRPTFSRLVSSFNENPQVCESAFVLISNMNMAE